MMLNDVDIRYRCNELLDSIGDYEIARYCYENNMMTKEQALKVVGDENKLKKHHTHCYILVDPDDVLSELGDDDIYEYLSDQGYRFPQEMETNDIQGINDKSVWLSNMRNVFSKLFTKIYDKEDFKKEFCKAVDDYLV